MKSRVRKKGSKASNNGLYRGDLRREAGLALLNSLVKNPRLGILVESHDGKILSLNDAFCTMFAPGGTADDFVGTETGKLFEHSLPLLKDPKKFFSRVESILKKGELVLGEEIYLTNGQILERDYVPLLNNGYAGHLWQYRDVTERKRFEDQMQRRDILMAQAQHLVHLGSWDWDIRMNSVTWSDELYRIYGLTPQDVMPSYESFLERVHPEDREIVKTAIEKAYSDHQPFRFDHRIVRPDGNVRTLHVRGVVTEDGDGKPVRMVWTGLDITDGLAVEEALRQTQQRYEALVESVEGIVWEADPSLRMTFVSRQAERLLGYPAEAWTTEPMFWVDHIIPFDRDAVVKRCQAAIASREKEEFEFRMIAADGRTLWLRGIVRAVSDHSQFRLRGIMVDVTERKNVEGRLKESFDQLRNLAVRLQSIREEESTRIALEIHDELGQALTGLKMDLTWLNKKIPRDQEVVLEKILSMMKLIDSTIQTVRRISTELRPGVLDDLGLVAAIEWQADEFQRRTGIRCSVSLPEDSIVMERDRSTAVFRILQETLTNITRHANAKAATITLRTEAGFVYLEVVDDGIGIPLQKVTDPKSMGLIGMRERAFFLGGRINVTGQPMQGTTVTLQVPYRPQ